MKNTVLKLLPFEKFEIKTELSKERILQKIKSVSDPEYADYRAKVSENGFYVAEKNRKAFLGGHTQNTFAPVASAKILGQDRPTVVSVTVRMHLLVCILLLPIYLFSAFAFVYGVAGTIVDIVHISIGTEITGEAPLFLFPFPFLQLLFYFGFKRPARRMKEFIENLIT
ncbi:MAG: hypothetical protein IJ391_04200 [Clostridia bacterium]|nr:hypothetical protein [Clostridia bacterium]